MYNVYEVYTWDDVSYTSDAKMHCDMLNQEHRKKAKEPDPICYTVMSDIQYYLLFKEC